MPSCLSGAGGTVLSIRAGPDFVDEMDLGEAFVVNVGRDFVDKLDIEEVFEANVGENFGDELVTGEVFLSDASGDFGDELDIGEVFIGEIFVVKSSFVCSSLVVGRNAVFKFWGVIRSCGLKLGVV